MYPRLVTTKDKILEKTAVLLRRHGHAKLGVVDVARALGMSHANIYRHFSSKAALIDAIARQWLGEIAVPLYEIASSKGDPSRRLRLWIVTLNRVLRERAITEPEHFAMYNAIAEPARDVVLQHFEALIGSLAGLVAELGVPRPKAAARTVFDATLRYHHPAFMKSVQSETELDALIALVLAGLRQQADKAAVRSEKLL